jgi:hypothetical protein
MAVDNSSPGKKLHIQGMLYAPSASFSLSGVDNDASWSTDGIMARQITAFRWNKGGGIPAVGGSSPPRHNRKVTIEVRDSSGRVLLRKLVQFDDNNYEHDRLGNSRLGRRVLTLSHARNPS